jgi:hypothetical protein
MCFTSSPQATARLLARIHRNKTKTIIAYKVVHILGDPRHRRLKSEMNNYFWKPGVNRSNSCRRKLPATRLEHMTRGIYVYLHKEYAQRRAVYVDGLRKEVVLPVICHADDLIGTRGGYSWQANAESRGVACFKKVTVSAHTMERAMRKEFNGVRR